MSSLWGSSLHHRNLHDCIYICTRGERKAFFIFSRCNYACWVHFHSLLQLYPTSVRTTGVGVASSVGRIGGMICPLVAVGLVHGCKQSAAVFLFESIVFVSGVCVYLLPFETRGLELSNNVSSSKHNHLDVSL